MSKVDVTDERGEFTKLSPVSFSDIDLFSEWVNGLGWDIESTQLSTGANAIRYDHFAFPDLSVAHYCVRQSKQSVFALPDGMVLFLITRTKLPLVWCGRHLPPTLLGVARSGREQLVVLPSGWDCYEFMVSEEFIRRSEIYPPSFFAETAQLERAFLPLMEPITGQFLQRMDAFFHQGRDADRLPGIAVRRTQFFDFIIDGLQQVIDAGLRARGLHKMRSARRPDLVMKGMDFVFARLTTECSAHEMAQALGVSYRVLNYAFQDTLGISPYQYIQTQKLHAIRRQLKLGRISVTEACYSYAYNTPSRFTRQYVRLFDELPSDTRRKNGQKIA